ncbi:MAG: M4 family metallopeptidase [Chlorobi bacterium]|nr:M4 family metallopeptidase [Chlorobiota bacterium]
MQRRLVMVGLLLWLCVSSVFAQTVVKPSFGTSPSLYRSHRNPIALPAMLDVGRLEYLRTLARSGISVTIAPHGGRTIYADRRALMTVHVKELSTQEASLRARDVAVEMFARAGVGTPELSVERSWRDQLGAMHVVLRQQIAGIPVWSSEVRVHFTSDGVLSLVQGTVFPTDALPSLANAIGADQARTKAAEYLAAITDGKMGTQSTWEARRVIFPERTPPWQLRSCWHVTAYPDGFQRWEVFVETETGRVVFAYNNTHRDGPATAQATDLLGQQRTINTYQLGRTYYLLDASRPMYNEARSQLPDKPIGAILTVSANNTDLVRITHIASPTNTWNDPASVSAHANAGIAYEYYRTTHNRNSLDGNGGTILSVIHVTQNGRPMDNAFWNGKVMAYGDGNIVFRPLARGLDVAAHEMSHGVIEHTANLVYLSQSGAINESLADVFGVMVDRDDWLVGEDVVNPQYFPSGAMRSFIDPHNGGSSMQSPGWQPRHMNEYQLLPETEEGDNGGVHVNSGIPNHACYLIAQRIGREKTERIYYRALTTYLTQNSQFLDLRRAVIAAARDLYGEGTETQAIASAFDAVGITDGGGGSSGPRDYEPTPGTDRLLVYAPGYLALYVFDDANNPTTARPVSSQSGLFSRPTVTDDGTVCVYVSADNTLRACALTSSTVQEQVLDATPAWRSIALSPDGKRLAATSTAYDPTVYVYDLNASPPTVRAFRLYTPNYSGDTSASQLVFADAMQWNLDGQTLLLDALNLTQTASGDTLAYWDILQIRVWDRASNTFGSGIITRALPVQPVGVSIGNPAYAKNSPYIIAFDRYDDNTGTYAVMAANLSTQTVEKLTDNTTLGYPSYRGDDGRIAVTTIVQQTTGIAALPLDGSKIRTAGNPVWLLTGAIVPVYFRVGQRPLSIDDQSELLTMRITPTPTPTDDAILELASPPAEWSWFLSDALGRIRSSSREHSARALISTTALEPGVYYCTVIAGERCQTLPLVVVR